MNELALFAGAGGGILGGKLLGWRTVCAVEWEPYAAGVLIARQNDGILPPFPIWDDVRTFDGNPWRGRVDVVSGGFPCQDISAAGKGAGIDGERSGMWAHMARIIGEVRPRYAFVENSPMLTSRGLGLGAVDAGAPHKRNRIWLVAHANCNGRQGRVYKEEPSFAEPMPAPLSARTFWRGLEIEHSESPILRTRNGVAGIVDRLKAIGNGQVPAVAALAWKTLTKEL